MADQHGDAELVALSHTDPIAFLYAAWTSAGGDWFAVGPLLEERLEELSEAGYQDIDINRRRQTGVVQFQVKIRAAESKPVS